jgi:hypothetical protein
MSFGFALLPPKRQRGEQYDTDDNSDVDRPRSVGNQVRQYGRSDTHEKERSHQPERKSTAPTSCHQARPPLGDCISSAYRRKGLCARGWPLQNGRWYSPRGVIAMIRTNRRLIIGGIPSIIS